MALQPPSDGCQCQTDNNTEDTWSVTTEPAAARRHLLRAFTYLHVQDEDTGVTRLVAAPCSYTLKRNERVTLGPQPMVVVPSAHYCIVESPVVRVDGVAAFDNFAQASLRHGEREVRLHQPPFPLYPGETLACSVQPLPVVAAGKALRLRAVQDTTDNEGTQRKAGDEWLVKKKGAYIPAVGEEVVEVLEPITLTRRQYCVVCITVMDGKPQHRILKGPQSFFLQPGEALEDGVRDICFLQANEGLDLIALEAFTDETVAPAVSRSLGDRWTVRGPAAVVPPVEAEVLRRHSAILLGPNEGVYVQNTVTGKVRVEMSKLYLLTAEERLWNIPRSEISVVGHVDATVVGANQALRLRAVQDTTDNEGTQRKAGDEWLVKKKGAYIPAVGEEVVEVLEPITLTRRQYCVVCITVMDGKPQHRILKGPQSFFLQPGEALEDGVRDICFLYANEGIDLVALEAFTDETVTPAVSRSLGDRWTVRGPAAVVPPVEVDVLRRRSAILLGPDEGVYVQNTVTWEVRAEMGKSYLLTAEERLWNKELPSDAEKLLAEYRDETGTGAPQRDKTRVVTYFVPDVCYAVVENRSDGETRHVYGPELVTLQPDEQFRVFSLPGGTPVVLNYSQSLTLPLSNNVHYLTDVITVRTENNERLALTVQIAWNVKVLELPGVAFFKDEVNLAFKELRLRLLEEARQGKLNTENDTMKVYFRSIHISDTKVLGQMRSE